MKTKQGSHTVSLDELCESVEETFGIPYVIAHQAMRCVLEGVDSLGGTASLGEVIQYLEEQEWSPAGDIGCSAVEATLRLSTHVPPFAGCVRTAEAREQYTLHCAGDTVLTVSGPVADGPGRMLPETLFEAEDFDDIEPF